MSVDDASVNITEQIINQIDQHLPLKSVTIPNKFILSDPWMTKGLMKSSQNSIKLYRKCIRQNKNTDAYNKIHKIPEPI